MYTSDEIKRILWNGANDLRGSMDASKYKDYMLGLMFYKFLSDKTLDIFKKVAELKETDNLVQQYQENYEEYGQELLDMIQDALGYYVKPEHLYQKWLEDIHSGDFELNKVIDSLNYFERSIAVKEDMDDFKGLFSSSIIDLNNTALGSDLNKRSKNIKDLILLFKDFNMVDMQEGDILGDAYEYLIGQFASNAGKKAGEFYTPHQVSEVMAQIVAKTTNVSTIYDPTVGSGSLLLTVKKHLNELAQENLHYYGQEYITETYNLTRMNLLLHGVRPEKMNIKNGNTLAQDWPEDPERPNEGVQFDAVVMNPPYSDKRWNDREDIKLKVSDPRFADFGVLPPSTKGDFAYLMHGLFHLGQSGTMAIVLPHGVLFRGAAEGEIRKRLIEKNYIDAVIGLPGQMFTNTGIPVCILILKKNRKLGEPVLFIDSSNHYIKIGKQNVLQEKDIARIVDTYIEKVELKGYSHLASREEMIENEYNLNIPRYVESIDNDIPHDVDGHLYGGIPLANIESLEMLKATVSDVLNNSLDMLREGYVQLNRPIAEVKEEVMADERVIIKSEQMKKTIRQFIERYMEIIRAVNENTDLTQLREEMLVEVKELLSLYPYVDEYSGYQLVAEIWKNGLTSDSELIAANGFYATGRMREKNMVTKGSGSNKREEQDGWVGVLIPNDIMMNELFADELKIIDDLKVRIAEIDSELSESVETAKVEDSEEYSVLYDSIKKNDEDEPQDTYEAKKIKAELKVAEKNSEEYQLIKNVDQLLNEKTAKSKKIKEVEQNLKEAVYERIEQLTEDEIDRLVQLKWFGRLEEEMVKLVEAPIQRELDTLDMLNQRYKDTLTSLDEEIEAAEQSLSQMMEQLVVR